MLGIFNDRSSIVNLFLDCTRWLSRLQDQWAPLNTPENPGKVFELWLILDYWDCCALCCLLSCSSSLEIHSLKGRSTVLPWAPWRWSCGDHGWTGLTFWWSYYGRSDSGLWDHRSAEHRIISTAIILTLHSSFDIYIYFYDQVNVPSASQTPNKDLFSMRIPCMLWVNITLNKYLKCLQRSFQTGSSLKSSFNVYWA